MHQVNLEYLAQGVLSKDGIYYPDSLVGTDSHTTMINGLGIVGWGVGGIEAEAGMLGQPVYFLTPDVVGVHLTGRLSEGVTATDLVLSVTEMLRRARVVGKFVEFFGEGAASLPVTDRATVANMAPEYGATMGFFPVDEETCRYLLATGRSREHVDTFRNYYTAQGLFGMPAAGDCDYTRDARARPRDASARASRAPKRPQDRIPLPELKSRFRDAPRQARRRERLRQGRRGARRNASRRPSAGRMPGGGSQAPVERRGRPRPEHQRLDRDRDGEQPSDARPVEVLAPGPAARVDVGHGDVLIAAITSCTNTSNPSVMLAAGLAREEGRRAGPHRLAARQGVARPRLARRHRVPREDRPAALPRPARLPPRGLRLHDLHRQLRPARLRDRGGGHQATTSSRPRSSRATATSRRASTRTSRRTS